MRDVKLCVLVITSSNHAVYAEHEHIWRSYMHSMPNRVHSYFLRSDLSLTTACRESKDVLYCRNSDTHIPGILEKTVTGLRHLLEKEAKEEQLFDFVLRTNLSSIFSFEKLLSQLEKLPKTKCYAGFPNFYSGAPRGGSDSPEPNTCYVSGCGIVLSRDAAVSLVEHETKLTREWDDIAIGRHFESLGYTLSPLPRVDIDSLELWHALREKLPPDVFHVRFKHWNESCRNDEEVKMHHALVEKFYPNIHRGQARLAPSGPMDLADAPAVE